jgi:hypothetical protein
VIADRGKPAHVAIRLPGQDVREGVVLETRLAVSIYAAGKDRPEAAYDKTLWILPENPFVARTQWLKTLKITLFDPQGTTAELLTKNVSAKAAVPAATSGGLLVRRKASVLDHSFSGCVGAERSSVKAAAGGIAWGTVSLARTATQVFERLDAGNRLRGVGFGRSWTLETGEHLTAVIDDYSIFHSISVCSCLAGSLLMPGRMFVYSPLGKPLCRFPLGSPQQLQNA